MPGVVCRAIAVQIDIDVLLRNAVVVQEAAGGVRTIHFEAFIGAGFADNVSPMS